MSDSLETQPSENLYRAIQGILTNARVKVYSAVNFAMVEDYSTLTFC